jgi:trehalose 6-phosphate synthase/phosphatase
VLEVRLVGIDKGAAAQKIMEHFSPDFTVCVGDDTTDEDMFRLLRDRAYTIKVGRGNTAAEYTVLSQREVVPMLENIFAVTEAGTVSSGQIGSM